jgi:hypothetical protein
VVLLALAVMGALIVALDRYAGEREFCSRCNVVTSSCCILGIRWDIKGEALG